MTFVESLSKLLPLQDTWYLKSSMTVILTEEVYLLYCFLILAGLEIFWKI